MFANFPSIPSVYPESKLTMCGEFQNVTNFYPSGRFEEYKARCLTTFPSWNLLDGNAEGLSWVMVSSLDFVNV